ncbi:HisA/HisF-related TIM barrel protein [Prochlorococcus sp. AH-716-D22]|nr:HisA/HisF-related TIM barrel protein [Prochlorococcus sp. AH-716-D22]
MLYPRLIPSLLVNDKQELVKTICFNNRNYLGEPLNTAYIFSGFEADELLVLDIDASKNKKCISLDFVKSLSTFTKVPLTVGGGISNLDQIYEILSLGVERITLSSALNDDFRLLYKAANSYGSSSLSVIVNTFRNNSGELMACFGRPEFSRKFYPIDELCKKCEDSGAGELIINQIDHEGTRKGFDINLMQDLNEKVSIPLVALGGCGSKEHISDLLKRTPISGISCGSFFVYAPKTSQVLLSYTNTSNWLKENFNQFKDNYQI